MSLLYTSASVFRDLICELSIHTTYSTRRRRGVLNETTLADCMILNVYTMWCLFELKHNMCFMFIVYHICDRNNYITILL